MKSQTKTTKAATTKAIKSPKVSPKAKGDTPIAAKVDNAPKPVFSLVAGTIAQIINKGLRPAIAYHVAKGNLVKVDAGVKLTEQGALLWGKERVTPDPAKFQEIAAFVHGGAIPREWNGNHKPTDAMGTLKGDMLKLPNMYYWGAFATSEMRKAFAALWSVKK